MSAVGGSVEPGGQQARALWFTAPRRAELLTEVAAKPRPDQVTVRAIVSLVSAGTEMLVYRGEVPASDSLGLETCAGNFGFPVKYGYQVVGEVVAAGAEAGYQPGDVVFARHPHQDLFTMRSTNSLLTRVPRDMQPERAVFVNLLEVALNCALDVPVRFGDVVVVFGYGVVGSFCAQLSRRTAGRLVVVDPIAERRTAALSRGADAAVSPEEAAGAIADVSNGRGADICIEASGAPSAVQEAVRACAQEGTIVEVSYFGTRKVPLVLSPEFHFRRQRIVSSQVGSIGSGLQPRWDLERRDGVAFELLKSDWVATPVSHRYVFDEAPDAYRVLDENARAATGILLVFDNGLGIG
jgi:2-desacetyl-2-hydroxyethyl bacteriochlorophyllide A dehydrogenase